MPEPIIMGNSSPQMQRQAFRFDPARGETVLTEWRGANFNNISDAANTYAFNGVSYDLEFSRGVGRLDADDATLNNPIDIWELIGDSERKDLFQNPVWGNGISDAQMAAILNHLDNNDDPATAFADSKLSSLAGGVVQRAYARYQAGNQEFENDAYGGGYVLRHLTNVPARWTTNISDFNVGCIYSTSALLTEINSTILWVLPVPPRLYYKINKLGASGPAFRDNFMWGWKKTRSTEETTANNRVNIQQNYVLELWSLDDYPIAS